MDTTVAATPPSKFLVLEGIDLVKFVQYVLDSHDAPFTLVICSTREAFLEQLQNALAEISQRDSEDDANDQAENNVRRRVWSVPTLRLLASSRTVKMAFCPEVTHLRAYLATYAYAVSKQATLEQSLNNAFNSGGLLAIINMINLHRPTSAFSAQGLNRTFAIAVEAAHFSHSKLLLAECSSATVAVPSEEPLYFDEEIAPSVPPTTNPWDEEMSILNVTTKSFGAGDRGWVGRTVKIRTIAERWFSFQQTSAVEE